MHFGYWFIYWTFSIADLIKRFIKNRGLREEEGTVWYDGWFMDYCKWDTDQLIWKKLKDLQSARILNEFLLKSMGIFWINLQSHYTKKRDFACKELVWDSLNFFFVFYKIHIDIMSINKEKTC